MYTDRQKDAKNMKRDDAVGIDNLILQSWADRKGGGDIFFVVVKCKEVDFLYSFEAPFDTTHESVVDAVGQQHIHFDRPEPYIVRVFHVALDDVNSIRRSRN